jgi:hypothetical protein
MTTSRKFYFQKIVKQDEVRTTRVLIQAFQTLDDTFQYRGLGAWSGIENTAVILILRGRLSDPVLRSQTLAP